jgi:heme/copper-type cytochrome/quinol oxidase subunit 1
MINKKLNHTNNFSFYLATAGLLVLASSLFTSKGCANFGGVSR